MRKTIILGVAVLGLNLYAADAPTSQPTGFLPIADDGHTVNTDFENGTLSDWTTKERAFNGQPVRGDTVHERRPDQHSRHQGNYWIGTYEPTESDGPRGSMESVPFKCSHPWAMFLIGGGSNPSTRVEICDAATRSILYQASGDDEEDMRPMVVDMRRYVGKEIYLRVVDDISFGWGHINFDNFRFYDTEPDVPKRRQLTPDPVKNAGLKPEDAVKAMTLPPGAKATVFAAEPDLHQPIGFTIDDRGRLWVAEAYTYPTRAPEGQGKDDILIFEDTDGDGKFDKRTVFTTGLNLVSGIEVGFGGVWVGAAPYFMFIPDKNHDDKPDGPPEILLDGFAYQDTHETLNTFQWGPDGWLYGCHGVFTHSVVGKPGTPEKDRVPINAGIWRYHPTKHVFEVFAEGTSNPWGIDWNDQGQMFSEACVIPHLYHLIQGGRYQRQAGQHFNPYIYKDIQTLADHLHWAGDKGPWAANNKSNSSGGGHAHAGMLIYQGDAFDPSWRNQLFMGNIHGNRINHDIPEAVGSGYVGHHGPDFLLMNDAWSRIVNLRSGPDGGIYFNDWYDRQACHNLEQNIWDRTNGRIYKLTPKDAGNAKPVNVGAMSDDELVQLQLNKNDWWVRMGRRILQERGSNPKVHEALLKIIRENPDPTRKLRGMWALAATEGFTGPITQELLGNSDPYVRAWAIQLGTAAVKSEELVSTFAKMASSDKSPVVRLYLASAMQRIPVDQRKEVLLALAKHGEDKDDHNLPLMYWYAAEPVVAADFDFAKSLIQSTALPILREFTARRVSVVGDGKESLAMLSSILGSTDDAQLQLNLLTGMNDGLAGKDSMPMPAGWKDVYDKLHASKNEQVRLLSQTLATLFGDDRALASLRELLGNNKADTEARRNALQSLIKAKDSQLGPILITLLDNQALRADAIKALATQEDPKTPAALIERYPSMELSEKRDALNTLASRAAYGTELMKAVQADKISKTDLPPSIVRQLSDLGDAGLTKWVGETWGAIRNTPKDKIDMIAKYRRIVASKASVEDPSRGRAIFAATCMQCHTLFGAGGKVGPDLTGSNRKDPDYLLQNIIDPSAVIPKDYTVSIVGMKDNRVLSGIIRKEDPDAITLQTENEQLVLPRGQIKKITRSDVSMMPEGLIAALKNDEVRDLFSYLRGSSQVPMLATEKTVKSFFNGKDLDGWEDRDMSLWHVENGEIVGKTTGLKENHFLISKMIVGDFKLTVQIKLVDDTGNSGIQFRSAPLENGEMKGYQADVGPGWWGRLYEEQGREILSEPKTKDAVKPGDWNTYEIIANGDHIETRINGKPCVNLNDPPGAKRGAIAFQLHAGGATEVRIKDIKLEVDPKKIAMAP
jgi:putative membrane-bound dehydrogenase-like protein